MDYKRLTLRPDKKMPKNYKIYAGDLEGDALSGVLGVGLYGEDECIFFDNAEDFFKHLKQRKFRGAKIFFHNLRYDFGLLYKYCPYDFKIYDLNGDIFKVTIYITSKDCVTLLDSSNFFPGLSIEKIGHHLGIEKLPMPDFLFFSLGKERNISLTSAQKEQLMEYCLRDAEIAYRAMVLFQTLLNELGGELKSTLASSAMDLFRKRFLNEEFYTPYEFRNEYSRNGYYGGRTENFVRGWWENVKIYDINSAYPYVMKHFYYPHPNYLKWNSQNPDLSIIMDYEGISEVEIEIPFIDPPLLISRYKRYSIFPYGRLRGFWTHAELREAVKYGAKIRTIFSSLYSTHFCNPFVTYVDTLYALRQEYKRKGHFFELILKILMNSLYGKFAQRADGQLRKWVKVDENIEELPEGSDIEVIGDEEFIPMPLDFGQAPYVNVLWAAYVTAYVRLELYKHILTVWPDIYYCDTDSIHTTRTLQTGNNLGELKYEKHASKALYVGPKEYLLCDDNEEILEAKAKGVKKEARAEYLLAGEASFQKPVGWREAARRHLQPSLWIELKKVRQVTLPKRYFEPLVFNPNLKQKSIPWEFHQFAALAEHTPRQLIGLGV